jgi:predicted RNase H-like HicB family nuclease
VTADQKYPKQVFWSDEDEGFIAIAPDLPGCSAFGESEAEALSELDMAIDAWIGAAKDVGNVVPAPSRPALRSPHSGKVLVRMPRSLHQNLVEAAKREDVSLNQFIVFVLSKSFSLSTGVSVVQASPAPVVTSSKTFGLTEGVVRAVHICSSGLSLTNQQANAFSIYEEPHRSDYWMAIGSPRGFISSNG